MSDEIEEFAEYIARELEGRLEEMEDETDVDLFELMSDELTEVKERALENLYPQLRDIDEAFFADPTNAVVFQTYPSVDRSSSDSETLGFEEVGMRSPYTEEEFERLRNATVGFSGYGGVEIASMGLAREGVGNFIFADPDEFDPSNVNRQAFCFEDELGRDKVEVGREYIKRINSEVSVETHTERVTEDNVEEIFGDADIIISAVDDFQAREAVNRFGRDAGKPVQSTIWGGYEGQYLTFGPDDPHFREVFPYTASEDEGETVEEGELRGASCVGINMLDSYVARDAVSLILGKDNVVEYPYVAVASLHSRTMPFEIRDVREIPFEYPS